MSQLSLGQTYFLFLYFWGVRFDMKADGTAGH